MRNAFRLGLALAFSASIAVAQVPVPRTGVTNSAQPVFQIDPATGLPIQGAGFPLLVNGSAPSITNPIWVANAETNDVTGTFTNATQTTNIPNTTADGYATALISVNGTYSAATGVFEESDDAGTTWYGVICARSDGTATETGYTLTNVSRQWSCPVGGNDSVRVRSTAVTSGTVNVRVGVSTPTNNSGVISGNVGILPPGTPETATSGNVANGTVAATLAASATKTTYVTGIHMTADGATGALAVDCTITGIITGTQTFTFGYGTLNAYTVRDIYFNPPMPASAVNTTIVASCPAGGSGAAHASMNLEGFQF